MKIAVLVKQVPGGESALPMNSLQNWVDESMVTYVMNPPDNYAIEEALLIKEGLDDCEVVVVSMGPQRVQKVIREGLAKGADRAIHIEEDVHIEKDPLIIARCFAKVLDEEKFDLVFTGLQSDDTGMGQTGVILGEMLGMSTATLAVETNISDGYIKVKRELESGWFQRLRLPLPASVSIQSGLNTPRYPSLKGIMGAKKKEIKLISRSEISSGSNSQSIDRIFIPTNSKQTEVIDGDPGQTVGRIIEILKSEVKVI